MAIQKTIAAGAAVLSLAACTGTNTEALDRDFGQSVTTMIENQTTAGTEATYQDSKRIEKVLEKYRSTKEQSEAGVPGRPMFD